MFVAFKIIFIDERDFRTASSEIMKLINQSYVIRDEISAQTLDHLTQDDVIYCSKRYLNIDFLLNPKNNY
jgi:hypothetical protein